MQRLLELSDKRLVERTLQGDDDAFTEIVRRHDAPLRRLVRRLLSGDDGVDDVMQETYLRAFRALPRFRGDASLATWLHRIAHNASVDHLRRRRGADVRRAEDGPEPVWSGPDPGDVAAARTVVAEALGRLTAGHRAVSLLVDCDGLDYAEAAAVLHLAPGTVASRLSRARFQLRRAIGEAA
jgi:RNA polymerase sigma-70 factor (ECF subfamily)